MENFTKAVPIHYKRCEMSALQRELVYYLCDQLEQENRKGNVLVIGKDAEYDNILFFRASMQRGMFSA